MMYAAYAGVGAALGYSAASGELSLSIVYGGWMFALVYLVELGLRRLVTYLEAK